MLASGEPDFPFALAWANETWSGTYHGLKDGEVLIEQTYPGEEDYIAHFNAVLPAFKDKRYIKCEGKPMFFIYIAEAIPNIKRFMQIWQKLAKENGLPGIYFVAHQQFLWTEQNVMAYLKPRLSEGFSAVNIVNKYNISVESMPLGYRIIRKVFHNTFHLLPIIKPYDIREMKTPLCARNDVIPSVIPNWDHTPRSGLNGVVLINSTPEMFKKSVQDIYHMIEGKDIDHRFIVIKSWNEWAEGNYMEPDSKYGNQYLEALGSVVL